jgi:hypothetical protein
MLPSLQASIKELIYERGRISPREVDVRFEAPTRAFVERLTRPTINLFLYDVTENAELRRNEFRTTRANGHVERRMAPRRIDLSHMVSVLTTEIEDEHLLLWRTLGTLLRYHEIPAELLPESIRELNVPVTTRTAQADDQDRSHDMWSALGIEPRATLTYVVTAPLDLDIVLQAPLILTRTARYSRLSAEGGMETGHQIGGIVRGPDGEPLAGVSVAVDGSILSCTTGDDGQYVLRNVPDGSVTLRVSGADGASRAVEVEVPGGGYDIDVD